MVKTKIQKTAEYEKPKIDEGIYEGICKEVKEITDGQYGARVAIICEIRDKEDNTVELAKVVYNKLTPNSAATKVIEAFGFEYDKFDEGFEFDWDAMVGRVARCWVEDYEYVKDGETLIASSISKFKSVLKEEELDVKQEKVVGS